MQEKQDEMQRKLTKFMKQWMKRKRIGASERIRVEWKECAFIEFIMTTLPDNRRQTPAAALKKILSKFMKPEWVFIYEQLEV